MPLDFPNTPVLNDTYTYGGYTWKYDGSVWIRQDIGSTGDKGGVKYRFSTTTTDADPGSSYFRYNNATIGSVTFIYIHNLDAAGVNQTAWYTTWDDSTATVKGQLTIVGNSDTTVNVFNVTGAVSSTGTYYKIPVSYVSGALPVNTSSYLFQFTAFGYTGATGPQDYVVSGMLYR